MYRQEVPVLQTVLKFLTKHSKEAVVIFNEFLTYRTSIYIFALFPVSSTLILNNTS